MKKIGILTLFYKTYNFGAQLQAYALQKAVASLGFTCEQIRFAWSSEQTRIFYENASVDQEAFEEFARSIPHSKRVYTPEDLWEAEGEYDGFLCGSDQIWGVKNSMPDHVLPLMALSFVKDDKKKIAYGASFGSAVIEEERKEIVKPFLERMDHISVRENTAAPAVEKMSGSPVTAVVDPVLLLSAEEWRKEAALEKKSRPEGSYVVLYSVSGRKKMYERALAFSRSKKLPLVYIAYAGGERIGPREFVSLIDHAAYVITDSYHGTVLSIIFQKSFITVGVDDLPEQYSKNTRMRDMLGLLSLGDRFFSEVREPWEKTLDSPWKTSKTEDKIREMAECSMGYLRDALCDTGKDTQPQNAPALLWQTVVDAGKCTGCGACAGCISSGIRMETDRLGFYRPILDTESCVDCGKCLEVCPVYPKQEQKVRPACSVLALRAKEEEVLEKSASGGAFFLIAEKWIDHGGVVCGAVYDTEKEFAVKHICTDTRAGLLAMQKSKYVQSDLGQCFAEIERYLTEGRRVLFSGTPCQAAGLKRYLQKDHSNLYVIDLVCGGVTAPFLWKKYVEYYQTGGKVDAFDMRSKAKGFFSVDGKLAFSMSHFKSGEEIIFEKERDLFLRPRMSFYGECCYQCHFKGDHHDADLTIGDLVGFPMIFPELKGDKGVSLVIVRSEKGTELVGSCQSACEVYPTTYEIVATWNEMLDASIKRPLGADLLRGIAPVSSIERVYHEGERIRMFAEKEQLLKDFHLELKRNDLFLRLKKYAAFQCCLEYDPSIEGEIIIYGAGKLGRALLDCMEGEPLCFLDRSKALDNVCGYPVYQMEQEEVRVLFLKKKVTVIITPVWDYWEIKERMEEIYPEIHMVSLDRLMERIGI